MAKDNRQILRGVRVSTHKDTTDKKGNAVKKVVGSQSFGPGQEDDLQRHLTKEQMLRLKEKGAIQGDWTTKDAQEQPRAEVETGGTLTSEGDASAQNTEAATETSEESGGRRGRHRRSE